VYLLLQALIKGLNADNQRLVTELQREKASVASLERKTAAVCVQMEKQLAEVSNLFPSYFACIFNILHFCGVFGRSPGPRGVAAFQQDSVSANSGKFVRTSVCSGCPGNFQAHQCLIFFEFLFVSFC
jgi:hypothetical protein